MYNKKNKKLLIHNKKINISSRIVMYLANLLMAILAVIFYQFNNNNEKYCIHSKKSDLKIDLYMASRVLISLFVLCILYIYIVNWLNNIKIYKNDEYVKIYKKYKDLLYNYSIKNNIIKKKWFSKAMSLYSRYETRVEKTFIFFALFTFLIEFISFLAFSSDYFSRYIDNDFYLFIKTPKDKLAGHGLFLLSFLCTTYLCQVVYRFFSILNIINKNYEVNCFKQIKESYPDNKENNTIHKLMEAIYKEKKKEFKIARSYFLITALPTFIMTSLIFILKLVRYFIPKEQYNLEMLSKASLIIIIAYQIIRLIVYPLHYCCNTDYKIDCGDIFNIQLVKSQKTIKQKNSDTPFGILNADCVTRDIILLEKYGINGNDGNEINSV